MRALLFQLAVATAAVQLAAVPLTHAAVEDDLRDGDRYFEAGEWKRAAAAYDRAIGKAPGQVAPSAYGKRAAIFIILKDYKGGLAFLAKAKAQYPNAPEVLEQEALILWETGKRDAAIEVAERAVKGKPDVFTNQKLIGEYYASRDPVKTATAYEAYLASRPSELEAGDVLPRVRLGFAYLTSARVAIGSSDEPRAQQLFAKAVEQFDTVQRKHGKRPNAQVNADNGLCAAYTGLGRFDQAVTVCERIRDARRIDPNGSVWFNLGTAYLARKQSQKARTAASEYIKLRKNEARGYILLGDSHFADRQWQPALEQYLRAEKLAKPAEQVQLSIRLGKTYRRIPAPAGGGANPNLALAIDKLAGALAANPTSLELATELGGAYLERGEDDKAGKLADRMLGAPATAKAPPAARASLLVIAGKAEFNQRRLDVARQRFEAARALQASDVQIQRALVSTINEQAFVAMKDPKAAAALLDQALPIDPKSPVTTTNLAVIALDRNDCDAARTHLAKLEGLRGHDVVVRLRLAARAALCGPRANPKQAAELYAAAEREAKKASAALALAEIYTEWAPLHWDTDLVGAVAKLEIAVQTSAGSSEVGEAAKRNLALGLYRRGWKLMREGKAVDAVSDFERALGSRDLLRGTEPVALEFSHALALLDAGRAPEAARLFKSLAAKGGQATYLKQPFAKIGSQLFAAYATYRNGSVAARQQAAAELARLEGDAGAFRERLRELIAGTWEVIAHEQWRSGQVAAALKSLQSAEKYATAEQKRRINMDRTALSLDKKDLGALEALGGNPPESLVNIGIIYEQLGRPKDAYEAWQRARARGVQTRDLQRWIDAKKRLYGF